MLVMLNCFQAEIFNPDMLSGIATAVFEESGIDFDEWVASPLANLLQTLRSLSPLERVTLADALEQSWYRAGEDGKTHFEVLAELGIELR
ncbi:protein of unknown function [Burkholderia multivorans]